MQLRKMGNLRPWKAALSTNGSVPLRMLELRNAPEGGSGEGGCQEVVLATSDLYPSNRDRQVPYTGAFCRGCWQVFGRRDLPWSKMHQVASSLLVSGRWLVTYVENHWYEE